MNTGLFVNYYLSTREKIYKELKKYNDELVKKDSLFVRENLSLFANLNYGGKAIRGVLAHLGYYLLKDNPDYALGLSLAYEIFQTAILIHDDIIDNDNQRRGKDTVHFANRKKYEQYSKDNDEVRHLSESIGIFTGNYGFFETTRFLAKTYSNDKNFGKVLECFSDVELRTAEGEIIDTILPFNGKHNIECEDLEKEILNIYRLKTAYYTVIGPLSVGLILAGGTKKMLSDIEKFGEKVGIAFQIQDDILGIYSDEIGKIKGSDIKEFKQTILYSHIMSTEYKDEFLKYYGKEPLTDSSIEKVQELFKKSNSLEYARNMMINMYNDALNILDSITWLKEDKKDLLRGFISFLRERNK